MAATTTALAPAKKGASGLMRSKARWGLLFISPWIVGFLLFYLVPMVASFVFSLLEFNLARPEDIRYIGFANWQRALTIDPEVPQAFFKTFKLALLILPVGMIFALILALLLNSEYVRGKALFRTLFYAPMMIPMVATTLIWFGVLNENTGWVNKILQSVLGIQAVGSQGLRWLADPALILYAYTLIGLWGVGNNMLITLAGLQNVPTELYEASKIDGANWVQRLWKITLPMVSPVIFYNFVLGVIGLFQYFLVPYVLNGGSGAPQGSTRFIMVWFYRQSFGFMNMGYGATLAWLIFLVAFVITVLVFGTARYWVYYAAAEEGAS